MAHAYQGTNTEHARISWTPINTLTDYEFADIPIINTLMEG